MEEKSEGTLTWPFRVLLPGDEEHTDDHGQEHDGRPSYGSGEHEAGKGVS